MNPIRALFLAGASAVLVTWGGGAGVPRAAADEGGRRGASGHVEFVNPTTKEYRTLLPVVEHASGDVTGEYEEHVEVASTGEFVRRRHATLVCVGISGNTARIGGVVDFATDGSEGAEGYFTVVDNGEGANDPPDLASPAVGGTPGVALEHCTRGRPRPLIPISSGNVQIHE
jgi:hypothetical protein